MFEKSKYSPKMRKNAYNFIKKADYLLSRIYISLFTERSSLLIFLFHSIFKNKKQVESNLIYPQQMITVDKFKQFINYYLEQNYKFIRPDDILKGLKPDRNYILLTFDDGYFNNALSFKIMIEYNIPATFFVTINNVLENKAFWWDVVYRNRKKQSILKDKISAELRFLARQHYNWIEDYLVKNFGKKALKPVGDLDRSFTKSELAELSKNPLMCLGNHTVHHAALTNYAIEDAKSEITMAQKEIFEMTGKLPNIISYPYGAFSKDVFRVAEEAGLKMGITGVEQKNFLPINFDELSPFFLKRFVLSGNSNIRKQCEVVRSDIHLLGIVRQIMLKIAQ